MAKSEKNQLKTVFQAAQLLHECMERIPKEMRQRALSLVLENLKTPIEQGQTQQISQENASLSYGKGTSISKNIKSFVDDKKPQTDVKYVTVVAYYYRFDAPPDDRKDTVNVKTIRESERLVQRRRMGDPGSTLSQARKAGYLDRVAPGEFSINTVGENLVAMVLPSDSAGTRAKRRPRKKANKKITTRN